MSSSFVLLKCKCAPVSYRPVWEISNTVMVFAQMRTLSIGAACEFTRGSEHFAGPCLVHSPQWLGKDDRVALHPPLSHLDLLQADHLLWPPIVLVWQGEHFLPRKIMWVEDQQPNWNQVEGFGRRKIVYLQLFWFFLPCTLFYLNLAIKQQCKLWNCGTGGFEENVQPGLTFHRISSSIALCCKL